MDGSFIIFFELNDEGNPTICKYDVSRDEKKNFDIPEGTSPINQLFYSNKNHVIYYRSDVGDYLINDSTGEATPIYFPEDWTGSESIRFTDDDKILVFDTKTVLELGIDGNVLSTYRKKGEYPTDVFYYNKNKDSYVIVAYSSSIGVFDRKTAKLIKEIDVDDTFFDSSWYADYKNNDLLIKDISDNLHVIDVDEWKLTAVIPDAYGYHPETHRIFTYSDSTALRRGYFDRYTYEELIDIGKESLHGEVLSEEQKSLYGIDD